MSISIDQQEAIAGAKSGNGKVHEALDRMSHKAAAAEDYIRHHAGKATHAAHAGEQELEHAIKHSSEKAKHFVEHNPMLSAGIAFGAGVLLTLLLRR